MKIVISQVHEVLSTCILESIDIEVVSNLELVNSKTNNSVFYDGDRERVSSFIAQTDTNELVVISNYPSEFQSFSQLANLDPKSMETSLLNHLIELKRLKSISLRRVTFVSLKQAYEMGILNADLSSQVDLFLNEASISVNLMSGQSSQFHEHINFVNSCFRREYLHKFAFSDLTEFLLLKNKLALELEDTKEKIVSLETAQSSLETSLRDSNKLNERLSEELNLLKIKSVDDNKKIIEKEESIKSISSNVTELREEIKDKNYRIETARKDLLEAKQIINAKSSKLDLLDVEIKRINRELARVNKESSVRKANNDSLELELSSSVEQVLKLQERIEKSDYDRLLNLDVLNKTRNELSDLKSKYFSLLEKQEKEQEVTASTLKQYQSQNRRLKKEHIKTENLLKSSSKEAEETIRILLALQVEYDQLFKAKVSIESELHQKQSVFENLNEIQRIEYEKLEEDSRLNEQHLQSKILKLEMQNSREHKKNAARVSNLTTQLAKVNSQIAQLNCKAQHEGKLFVSKFIEPIMKIENKLRKQSKLDGEVAMVLASGLFDIDWYLETYPDVKKSEMNPALHYIKYGWKESRQPSPYFDGVWYIQRYKDVAAKHVNPLVHYLTFGIDEGRQASPRLLKG